MIILKDGKLVKINLKFNLCQHFLKRMAGIGDLAILFYHHQHRNAAHFVRLSQGPISIYHYRIRYLLFLHKGSYFFRFFINRIIKGFYGPFQAFAAPVTGVVQSATQTAGELSADDQSRDGRRKPVGARIRSQ